MTDWNVIEGDCVETMAAMEACSVDAVVCDPPYGLEFMGKEWDSPGRMPGAMGLMFDREPGKVKSEGYRQMQGKMREYQAWCEAWAREALRVLRPGGHLLAFGGTRTYHRLACAVEDAGFEIRDTICWLYGQGFPKSLNVGCRCGNSAALPEHDVRPVLGADLQATVDVADQRGEVLLEGVSESGAPGHGFMSDQGSPDGAQSGVEGRCDVQAPEGEPQGSALRPMPGVATADGSNGWVRDGAPHGHGDDGLSPADEDGVRASSGSRPAEQCSDESRTVADQPGSQDGRGWPLCPRCGKPTAGLGTALKPSHEPIVVARKPLAGTVAGNVLAHGTGALNVDGCRIAATDKAAFPGGVVSDTEGVYGNGAGRYADRARPDDTSPAGRWPANVVLAHTDMCRPVGTRKVKGATSVGRNRDGEQISNEVYGARRKDTTDQGYADADGTETVTAWQCHPECPVRLLDEQTGERPGNKGIHGTHGGGRNGGMMGEHAEREYDFAGYGDTGGASRFMKTVSHQEEPTRFRYVAKASSAERNAGLDGFEERRGGAEQFDSRWKEGVGEDRMPVRANVHPTVKPIDLMRWLVRLVTPPGGTCLDPFAGSGTTGIAAVLEGFDFIGIEREPEYIEIANTRIAWWADHPEGMKLVQRLEAETEQKAIADAGQLGLFG